MNILVTGGTGYIGSHTVIELLNKNNSVVIVDNLSNSSDKVITRIKHIANKDVDFYNINLCNEQCLDEVFTSHDIDAVIHFAGFKAVGESVEKPLGYYENNILSTLVLLQVMKRHAVSKIVFSSSATVYGDSGEIIYKETQAVGKKITSPYGKTKFMIEEILHDTCVSDQKLEVSVLRYFNPIGAHESGQIGENPKGIPNNLMPFIAQVALGLRDKLSIYGNDYPTPDGTCRRDYIHVVDLAKGHVAALNHLKPGIDFYNLGSGKPTSVLELVNTFTKVTGKNIPYEFAPRRDGDLAEFYADPGKAKAYLKWEAKKTLEDMCIDTWHWQSQNPQGYED